MFFGSKKWKSNGRPEDDEDEETFVSQKALGNRNWFDLAPARSHERNETTSREGPLALTPPCLRYLYIIIFCGAGAGGNSIITGLLSAARGYLFHVLLGQQMDAAPRSDLGNDQEATYYYRH